MMMIYFYYFSNIVSETDSTKWVEIQSFYTRT